MKNIFIMGDSYSTYEGYIPEGYHAYYGDAVEKSLREYKRKANIPGFRPGMVPMGVIKKMYGKADNLLIYEGMSKWSEIQYAYLIGEAVIGKREEIITRMRQDEYGFGFIKYADKYPLSTTTTLKGPTPFDTPEKPL